MLKTSCSVDAAITLLNDLLERDPEALHTLMETRVPCNDALADHPTVQVGTREDGTAEVGILGILNGMFGVDSRGRGAIASLYNDGKLIGFIKSISPERPQP